jgi:hypothetical protein
LCPRLRPFAPRPAAGRPRTTRRRHDPLTWSSGPQTRCPLGPQKLLRFDAHAFRSIASASVRLVSSGTPSCHLEATPQTTGLDPSVNNLLRLHS